MEGEKEVDETPAVVIDNGSCTCRAGLAGEDAPRAAFPSIVGCSRQQDWGEWGQRYSHVGADALSSRGTLQLRYPVEHGCITDWEGMEQLWRHVFTQELKVNPENHFVLLNERPINPKGSREKMTQIMFEAFSVPGFYLANHSALAMIACGRTTGIVVDVGNSVTHTVPMHEGFVLPHAVHRLPLGGVNLSSFLLKMLQEQGHPLDSVSDREEVNSIKERFCSVALNYAEEVAAFSSNESSGSLVKEYTLPDGSAVVLGAERIRCPEALFQPSLIGMEMPGVHEIAHGSIKRCDPSILDTVYGNVVLSGGTALFPGMVERLQKELTALAPDSVQVRVVAPPAAMGNHSVWTGGSRLASQPAFRSMCITSDEYNECGPSLVHRKCY